jgi:hypothetical protein
VIVMPLWKLLHLPAPKGLLRLVEFVPVVLGVAILFFVLSSNVEESDSDLTPIPVALAPVFAPLDVEALRLEPMVLRRGQTATLHNGICNHSETSITATIYLGAQEVDKDPLVARTIDLIGRDSPEGRQRRTVDPGCIGREPLTSSLPDSFTPGKWRLTLRVIAVGPRGEMQNIVSTSPTFWVVE